MAVADEGMEAYYVVKELTYMYSFPEAALDLNIPDILHAAGEFEAEPALTPHQIADRLPRKSPDAPELLHRILRLLAHHGVFSKTPASDSLSTRYGLNAVSKYLVTGAEFDLKPYVRLMQQRDMVEPVAHMRETVEDGKNGFALATGMDIWSYASEKADFDEAFNAAMRSQAKVLNSVFAHRYEGFRHVQCLVDVGGGVGGAMTQIVSAHPHIRGVNFDLPHVVATAPHIVGVEHVLGSLLEFVPPGDAILLQNQMYTSMATRALLAVLSFWLLLFVVKGVAWDIPQSMTREHNLAQYEPQEAGGRQYIGFCQHKWWRACQNIKSIKKIVLEPQVKGKPGRHP